MGLPQAVKPVAENLLGVGVDAGENPVVHLGPPDRARHRNPIADDLRAADDGMGVFRRPVGDALVVAGSAVFRIHPFPVDTVADDDSVPRHGDVRRLADGAEGIVRGAGSGACSIPGYIIVHGYVLQSAILRCHAYISSSPVFQRSISTKTPAGRRITTGEKKPDFMEMTARKSQMFACNGRFLEALSIKNPEKPGKFSLLQIDNREKSGYTGE